MKLSVVSDAIAVVTIDRTTRKVTANIRVTDNEDNQIEVTL